MWKIECSVVLSGHMPTLAVAHLSFVYTSRQCEWVVGCGCECLLLNEKYMQGGSVYVRIRICRSGGLHEYFNMSRKFKSWDIKIVRGWCAVAVDAVYVHCIVIERCGFARICGPRRSDSGDCLNSFCEDEKHHIQVSNGAAKSFNCEF